MKKLFLTLGLASLFMVACNNTPKQPEQPAAPAEEQKTEVVEEKHECPMDALKNEYAKWDEMTDEAKAECEKKCAEMKAAWDNFANMTVDEQKDLIMSRLQNCGGEKECCKHEAPAETPAK